MDTRTQPYQPIIQNVDNKWECKNPAGIIDEVWSRVLPATSPKKQAADAKHQNTREAKISTLLNSKLIETKATLEVSLQASIETDNKIAVKLKSLNLSGDEANTSQVTRLLLCYQMLGRFQHEAYNHLSTLQEGNINPLYNSLSEKFNHQREQQSGLFSFVWTPPPNPFNQEIDKIQQELEKVMQAYKKTREAKQDLQRLSEKYSDDKGTPPLSTKSFKEQLREISSDLQQLNSSESKLSPKTKNHTEAQFLITSFFESDKFALNHELKSISQKPKTADQKSLFEKTSLLEERYNKLEGIEIHLCQHTPPQLAMTNKYESYLNEIGQLKNAITDEIRSLNRADLEKRRGKSFAPEDQSTNSTLNVEIIPTHFPSADSSTSSSPDKRRNESTTPHGESAWKKERKESKASNSADGLFSADLKSDQELTEAVKEIKEVAECYLTALVSSSENFLPQIAGIGKYCEHKHVTANNLEVIAEQINRSKNIGNIGNSCMLAALAFVQRKATNYLNCPSSSSVAENKREELFTELREAIKEAAWHFCQREKIYKDSDKHRMYGGYMAELCKMAWIYPDHKGRKHKGFQLLDNYKDAAHGHLQGTKSRITQWYR
jgi:hypothetical protein